jgi:hypothetical protein
MVEKKAGWRGEGIARQGRQRHKGVEKTLESPEALKGDEM